MLFLFKQADTRGDRQQNRPHFQVQEGEQKEERHIPILKDLGIPQWIEPLDIYLALEEYFMKQKTDTERIDPIGQTNDDKIIVHGFDTETSFRGK